MPPVEIHGIPEQYWPQTLTVRMSFSTLVAEAAGGVKRACLVQPDFVLVVS